MKIIITEEQMYYLEASQWIRRRIDTIDNFFTDVLHYANMGFNPKSYNKKTWSDNAMRMFISDIEQYFRLHYQTKEYKTITKILRGIYYNRIENYWEELNQVKSNNDGKS